MEHPGGPKCTQNENYDQTLSLVCQERYPTLTENHLTMDATVVQPRLQPTTDTVNAWYSCPKEESTEVEPCNGQMPSKNATLQTRQGMEANVQQFVDIFQKLTARCAPPNQGHEDEEPIFMDTVMVYDRKDFNEVLSLTNKMKTIVKEELNETCRIELFDDERFVPSKVTLAGDAVSRSSLILVYLSQNCDGKCPEIELLCDQIIGLTRLGVNSKHMPPTNKWVLRPVHTEDENCRSYKTPVGLVNQNGIEWHDPESLHTRNRITAILKEAIWLRKYRERNYEPRIQETRQQTTASAGQGTQSVASRPAKTQIYNRDKIGVTELSESGDKTTRERVHPLEPRHEQGAANSMEMLVRPQTVGNISHLQEPNQHSLLKSLVP